MRSIYLDHAAATPLDPRVKKAMSPFLGREFANPSALYAAGVRARKAVEDARRRIAVLLGVRPQTLIFTSGGTESDNLALLGVARAHREKGRHVIISDIEHPAVEEAAQQLSREGFEVTRLAVDAEGVVHPKTLAAALRHDTILVSVMYANNEIGTIQSLHDLVRVLRRVRKESGHAWPYFHTDAAQAAGYCPLYIPALGVDLLSLNGSKLYGPKGIGLLYVREGVAVEPLMFGGGQERGLRAGTEHVAGIVGLATALEIAEVDKKREGKRVAALRARMIARLLKTFPDARVNGSREMCLPNTINISLPGVEGESVVLYLAAKGVAASTGSACATLDRAPSRVLAAIGLDAAYAAGSVRFTLGRGTVRLDIDEAVRILQDVVTKLRI